MSPPTHPPQSLLEMAVKTSSAATDALSDNLSFEMDPRSIVELARGAVRQARAAAAAGRGGGSAGGGGTGGGTGSGASTCASPAWRDGIQPGVRA